MRLQTLHVRKTFEPDRLRSILVASPNWLGDAVLALPALANLRRSFPSVRISLLVRPWLSPLFRSLPCIDELVELPGRGELKWAATALRQREFELALLLPNSFRIALISRLAGIPHRVGYATDWRDSLLTVGVRPSSGTPLHQADAYLGLLRALQWDAWVRPTGFLRPPGSDAEVEKLLAESGLPPHAPVVGMTPGATYGTAKRWPVERFAEVADRLADRFGTVALLFGSSREASLTRAIRSRMRGAVIDFGGRTTLAELAGLLSRCALLLTNDTGPMHLASALGIPCVALFGPTDPHRTGPLGSGHQVLHNPPTCSPCRYRDCPIDHRCMQELDVERVVAAAEILLARSHAPADASIRPAPAVFLDRDGTINEEVGPIQRPDMMRPIPKAAEALKRLGEAGYRRIVVSNQARVARGDATEELVEASHQRLLELLQADGGGTDAFYYCPHHPREGRFPYRRDCLCRKPAPGLIQRAAYEQQVDLGRSYVVGDKVSDMLLADGLSLPSVLVLTGYGRESLEHLRSTGGPMPAYTARDLLDATEWIVQRCQPA
ncbi:MAG: lipopolysaccharide heptosyltransferase II [Candidatus Methylomirabilis oxygeniifera]|uniref:lipopolysaccharide heptosyltransferase II n=1 Tax=Methylomirabilis oxygeniifera TaxID=671143 RepID=D5MG18_METO1|nr:MAG: lipopolysaccharide heptosyltransferase II [Candidatus Methylomirabilis oxyfera]CBE68699.1 ADP-heptose--LPS heptosyltransferase II (modular protein) [Candidatus Methylomirabilis oxyfera]